VSEAPPPFPAPVRAAFAAALLLVALTLAEGAVRVVDGNAFPQLRLFRLEDGQVRLASHADARLRRADGVVYTLHTGVRGLRLPETGGALLVGDSQALGLGVADDATFAALAGLRNAGVPGHGVPDAVAHARELVPALGVSRVYVMLNQANDWTDGLRPAAERYVVAGGWLGSPARRGTAAAAFWASPLSLVHLFAIAAMVTEAPPAPPPAQPDAAEAHRLTLAFAAQLRALRADLPGVEVVPLFLPADAATSEARAARSPLDFPGRPWADRTLRDDVRAALPDFPLVDLADALGDPDDFLPGDFHLSEAGHRVVAAALHPGAP
jgi:hypothetical protein